MDDRPQQGSYSVVRSTTRITYSMSSWTLKSAALDGAGSGHRDPGA